MVTVSEMESTISDLDLRIIASRLPVRERVIFVMTAHGFKQREIADELELSVRTIASEMRRIIRDARRNTRSIPRRYRKDCSKAILRFT